MVCQVNDGPGRISARRQLNRALLMLASTLGARSGRRARKRELRPRRRTAPLEAGPRLERSAAGVAPHRTATYRTLVSSESDSSMRRLIGVGMSSVGRAVLAAPSAGLPRVLRPTWAAEGHDGCRMLTVRSPA